jgi:hypothetical protein
MTGSVDNYTAVTGRQVPAEQLEFYRSAGTSTISAASAAGWPDSIDELQTPTWDGEAPSRSAGAGAHDRIAVDQTSCPVGARSFRHSPITDRATRYFGLFNKSRRDRWMFGDRNSGAYLTKFSWTKIVRHVPVRGRASHDDPALDMYWADRRRRRKAPPVDEHTARLVRAQGGRCPSCGEFLLHADHDHAPHSSGRSGSRLSGGSCASSTSSSRPTAKTGRSTDSFTPTATSGKPPPRQHTSHDADAGLRRPWGLLEPDAWKPGTSGSEGARATRRIARRRGESAMTSRASPTVSSLLEHDRWVFRTVA